MKILQYFFESYFNQTFNFEDLDNIIKEFKDSESSVCQKQLITEICQIIQAQNYDKASTVIKKYGDRMLNLKKTMLLINFLYNKLTNTPTNITSKDFTKNFKGIFCPSCCPRHEFSQIFNLIEEATIKSNKQHIYICKQCKLVWLSDDIQANNAKKYTEFMQSLGLKGLWNELTNVSLL